MHKKWEEFEKISANVTQKTLDVPPLTATPMQNLEKQAREKQLNSPPTSATDHSETPLVVAGN